MTILSDKKIPLDILHKVEEWQKHYRIACNLRAELDEYFENALDVCVYENSYEVIPTRPDESMNCATLYRNGTLTPTVAFEVEGSDKYVSMDTFF
jgi:hypothetical protein